MTSGYETAARAAGWRTAPSAISATLYHRFEHDQHAPIESPKDSAGDPWQTLCDAQGIVVPAEPAATGEAGKRHPWRLTSATPLSKSVELIDDNDRHVLLISTGDKIAMGQAARILACVNACAGIPTDRLERGTLNAVLEHFRVGLHGNSQYAREGRNLYSRLRGDDDSTHLKPIGEG